MRRTLVSVLVGGLLSLGAARPVAAQSWIEYSDIGPKFDALEGRFPDLCARYDLGLSVEGRHLWALRISDNVLVEEDEPEFKYIASMHGDEILGATLCMMLVDHL
ncbi:MAG: M14 family zinc carboxypeptidase, partial [Planctomycetota bacterium]